MGYDKGLYTIACLLEDLKKKLSKLSGVGLPITNVKTFELGNTKKVIYSLSRSTLGAIEIINETYDKPDILDIYLSGISGSPIPINSGESRIFVITYGVNVEGKFRNIDSGNVTVIEYDITLGER